MTHLITAPIPVTFSQEIVLAAASWTGSGTFTQTIAPITSNMPKGFLNSDVDCSFEVLLNAGAITSAIKWQTTNSGTIIFTTLKKPSVDIKLRVKFWRSMTQSNEATTVSLNSLSIDEPNFRTNDNPSSLTVI